MPKAPTMPNSRPPDEPNLGTMAPATSETPGERVIRWIEQNLFVPEGKLIGAPVRLSGWQQFEIKRIYDNPHGTRRAILSLGRKNGKTSLSAMLLLVHLCGPRHQKNSSLFSTAQSRDQAALIFQIASKIVRMSPALHGVVTIKDGSKELLCPELGTRYRALSAEATTAYGLSPAFVIHDELGQVRGPRSKLFEAIETSVGAMQDPLSIVISTQAPTDADLLSILIDDALGGYDPRVIVSLYTAPMDDDPFDVETIKKANPAFAQFLNPNEVMAMAADAKRMRAREAEFRNLILNQRVEASSPFVQPATWKANSGKPEDLAGREVYVGLDLSEVSDLTAMVVIGRVNKLWHVHPTFWLPAEGLAERARQDRVPYDLWHEQGFLHLTPGKSVGYEYVARHLFQVVFARYRVRKLAFDRWNIKHLFPWLINAGFSEQMFKERFVEFGQGTQSMSPALRELEAILLEGELRHGNHPVLSMCAANAVVEGKDSANRKLSKKNSSGRIDGMVALAMAIGVAPRRPGEVDLSSLIA
jgi:phage terminase large subunit-like protein